MKICEKSACSFPNWYPIFKNVTIPAEYIPIPDEVLQYLKDDGVTIPREALIEKVKSSYIDDITYTDWDSEGEDDDEVTLPTFPDFSNQLRNIMKKFGGSVFVKLNWSAPTDAAWIATNNCLKCSNLQDIYLLLKSSDKISQDLDAKYNKIPSKYFIVLKKWEDIHPGSEFRCFVSDKQLIAITQRDTAEFHRHIIQSKCDIINDINRLFYGKINDKFVLSNYSFDVVWNPLSIKIVDFNVFISPEIDTYLFSSGELQEMQYEEGISPEFRYIGEDVGIQPVNLGRHFGMPKEFSEISADKSRSLIELLQTQNRKFCVYCIQ
uniref:Putative cell division cycle protein n=1 Tax=Panstrongylus lignarius TaxID=156445 RepID=A0A224XSJ0_9HEMI